MATVQLRIKLTEGLKEFPGKNGSAMVVFYRSSYSIMLNLIKSVCGHRFSVDSPLQHEFRVYVAKAMVNGQNYIYTQHET